MPFLDLHDLAADPCGWPEGAAACREAIRRNPRLGVAHANLGVSLWQEGLIRREPDKSDRRAVWIRLSPKGRALANSVIPAHAREIASIFRNLNAEEIRKLRLLLDKLIGESFLTQRALRRQRAPRKELGK